MYGSRRFVMVMLGLTKFIKYFALAVCAYKYIEITVAQDGVYIIQYCVQR